MRASLSTERLATIIHREIVYIISNVIGEKSFGYINVTEVKVTKDLSFANIYYTLLTDDKDMLLAAKNTLENNKIEIRKELAKKIKNCRKIPDLIFLFDDAIAYGNRIEELLKQIKK